MPSPWTDLERPPLSAARLQRRLARDPVWRDIRVVGSLGSTQAELAAAARSGAPEGTVLVAEEQTAGRGRLARAWSSPPRAGLLLSMLLRPPTGASTHPLLPLLAGLGVLEAVVGVGDVPADLKWPNDVMVDNRKLAGLLAERVGDAVVVGVGLNVSTREDELPVTTATSIALSGGTTDREVLLLELLRAISRRYGRWCDTRGAADSVLPAYRERCATIGRRVRFDLPGGDTVVGTATAVDDGGRLVVRDEDSGETTAWSAGDVTHVRGED